MQHVVGEDVRPLVDVIDGYLQGSRDHRAVKVRPETVVQVADGRGVLRFKGRRRVR